MEIDKEEKSKRVVESVPEVFSLERITISEEIIHELVKVMNHIHQVNYTYRFWKILMGDYVNALVSIKHILEKEEMKSHPPLQPLNSHHVPTTKEKIMARAPSVIKHFKTLGSQSRIFNILEKEKNISIGLPDIDVVKADTGPVMPSYFPIYTGKGNTSKRKRATELAGQYASLFYRNMVAQLPQIYVEYFDGLFNKIPLHNPKEKIFHAHGLPDFYSCLIIAKYLNQGAKLYCYQHGAYYGEMKGHNSHFNEGSVADEFRTWGWIIRKNDVPWKAYRMEKFRLDFEKVNLPVEYDFLMCYPPVFYANQAFFKKISDYFLANIDAAKYAKILARPRPMNRMFSHAGKLSFITDKRVTIDSGLGKMAEAMSKCRLSIQFTVPATNFMECLYINYPTIGLLDNNQPTDIIKPYYDFFLQKGVLHNDLQSLVDHLNKIELDEWWASLIKEPLYLQFKNEFLRKA